MKKENIFVVTSYFNNRKELVASLDSITEPCDVLIVDDGSEIPLSSFFSELSPLIENVSYYYITNDENRGIPYSLNRALLWGESRSYIYYCRLDSGDKFIGNKLLEQSRFLDSNSEYVMVGSFAYINSGKNKKIWRKPVEDSDIRSEMFLNSPYIHSTVMIKLDALIEAGSYNESFPVAQDYEMLSRLKNYGKLHNLPKCLISYDYNSSSISSKKRKVQIKNRLRVQAEIFDFSFKAYYGVIRTLGLSFLSRDFVNSLKSLFRSGV